jgi:hypothetical protein
MATMLEVGWQILRGEQETFPLARLLGLVLSPYSGLSGSYLC